MNDGVRLRLVTRNDLGVALPACLHCDAVDSLALVECVIPGVAAALLVLLLVHEVIVALVQILLLQPNLNWKNGVASDSFTLDPALHGDITLFVDDVGWSGGSGFDE